MILAKPILMIIVLTLISGIVKVVITKKQCKKEKRESLSDKMPKSWKQYFVTMIIVVFYFNQSHIIAASLDILNCQNLYSSSTENKYYLFSDPDTQCWVGFHRTLSFAIAIPMILIWTIFIPIFTFYLLRRRQIENKKANTSTSSYNTNIYTTSVKKDKVNLGQVLENVLVKGSIKSENYFWELLIPLRKALILLALSSLRRVDFLESISVALFIVLIFTFIHFALKPYKFESLNRLEFVGYCSVSLLLISLIVYNGSKSDDKYAALVFNILFTGLSIIFVFFIIYYLFMRGFSTIKSYKEIKQLKNMAKSSLSKQKAYQGTSSNLVSQISSEQKGILNHNIISQLTLSTEQNLIDDNNIITTNRKSNSKMQFCHQRNRRNTHQLFLTPTTKSTFSTLPIDTKNLENSEFKKSFSQDPNTEQKISQQDLSISFPINQSIEQNSQGMSQSLDGQQQINLSEEIKSKDNTDLEQHSNDILQLNFQVGEEDNSLQDDEINRTDRLKLQDINLQDNSQGQED